MKLVSNAKHLQSNSLLKNVVSSLVTSKRTAYLGMLYAAGVAIFVSWLDQIEIIWATTALLCFAIGMRAFMYERYRNFDFDTKNNAELKEVEKFCAAVCALFAGSLAVWAGSVLVLSDTIEHHLLAAFLFLTYFSVTLSRHHASALVTAAQVIAAAPIMCVAMLISQDGSYWIVGPSCLVFFTFAYSFTNGIRKQMSETVSLQHKNTAMGDQFHDALDHMQHGLMLVSPERAVLVTNHQLTQLFNNRFSFPQGPQATSLDIFFPAIEFGVLAKPEAIRISKLIDSSISQGRSGKTNVRLDNKQVFEITCSPTNDGGCVAVFEDVTAQRNIRSHMDQLAHFDSLTGLMNRARVLQELQSTLTDTTQGCSVLFLDLDKFKAVNDTLGHPIGDAVLVEVSQRIKETVGKKSIVGRIGGDEFIVVLNGDQQQNTIKASAAELIKKISEPYFVQGHEIHIGLSIGISSAPKDGANSDELLNRADMALYESKNKGRGQYNFFNTEIERALKQRAEIEKDLKNALSNNEISVKFQPIFRNENFKIDAVEALARWEHPSFGQVLPEQFIPMAEDIGIIEEIGEFILREAVRECKKWTEEISVTINATKSELLRDLAVKTRRALDDYQLPAERFIVEIKEAVLLDETHNQLDASIVDQLHKLRNMGVRIALDDFGMGHSSLSLLHEFPIDAMKLHHSFTSSLTHSPRAVKLLQGVISMCDILEIPLTIAGVEEEREIALCRQAGNVMFVQGYLFGIPMSSRDIADLISAKSGRSNRASLKINGAVDTAK